MEESDSDGKFYCPVCGCEVVEWDNGDCALKSKYIPKYATFWIHRTQFMQLASDEAIYWAHHEDLEESISNDIADDSIQNVLAFESDVPRYEQSPFNVEII